MNKISVKRIDWSSYHAEGLDQLYIDEKSLGELMSHLFSKELYKHLIPTFTYHLWHSLNRDFIWNLLDSTDRIIYLPILMCGDDCDLGCYLIIAEVQKNEQTIEWLRFGTPQTYPKGNLPYEKKHVEWAANSQKYLFDKTEYAEVIEYYRKALNDHIIIETLDNWMGIFGHHRPRRKENRIYIYFLMEDINERYRITLLGSNQLVSDFNEWHKIKDYVPKHNMLNTELISKAESIEFLRILLTYVINDILKNRVGNNIFNLADLILLGYNNDTILKIPTNYVPKELSSWEKLKYSFLDKFSFYK